MTDNAVPVCGNCPRCDRVPEPDNPHANYWEEVPVITLSNGDEVCGQCSGDVSTYVCDRCATNIPNGDHVYALGDIMCPECFDELHAYCEHCGETYRREDISGGVCISCEEAALDEEDAEGGLRGVYDYSYKVEEALSFLGKPQDRMYMGVELEIECGYRNRQNVADMLNAAMSMVVGKVSTPRRVAVLKTDGSLDNGLELVTAPMSYEMQKEVWGTLGPVLSSMRGIKSHNTHTCGLHIHVTRQGVLSPLHVGKLVVFLNDKANEDFLATLARRRGNPSYALFKQKKLTDYRGEARYEVLNTTRSATIEFRLFRGTTKKATLLATIDFVYSVVKYTKWCSTKELGWKEYLRWLKKEEGYKDLKRWLVAHDYHIIMNEEVKKCA